MTSVPLVSTPVLQICPARVANSATATAMPPPTSVPLGRVMLPKLSGLHPIAVVYGLDGVLEVVESDPPSRVPTPMPASNRPAEESDVRSNSILESNPVWKSQPQPEQRQGEPENAAEGEDAISEGRSAVAEDEESVLYNRPSSPSYRPSSPTREPGYLVESLIPASSIKVEPMDTTDAQVISVHPDVKQLLRELRSRDRKLIRARACLSSMAHNVHRRILYRREIASLRTVFRDKELISDTEIAALRAQLGQIQKEKECMSLANSRLISKQIRLSQTIRQLHITLGRMRQVNQSFAARFATRAQY